jgi:hypothetical protein
MNGATTNQPTRAASRPSPSPNSHVGARGGRGGRGGAGPKTRLYSQPAPEAEVDGSRHPEGGSPHLRHSSGTERGLDRLAVVKSWRYGRAQPQADGARRRPEGCGAAYLGSAHPGFRRVRPD